MKTTTPTPFAQVTKEDVAEVLLRIAAILELAEDNPYRALAYRRAARLVLTTPRQLHTMLTKRGFLDLPGIGTSLRRKLGELVMTGRLRFGLEMSARLPEAAADLLDLPGAGPRLARRERDRHDASRGPRAVHGAHLRGGAPAQRVTRGLPG